MWLRAEADQKLSYFPLCHPFEALVSLNDDLPEKNSTKPEPFWDSTVSSVSFSRYKLSLRMLKEAFLAPGNVFGLSLGLNSFVLAIFPASVTHLCRQLN